MLENSSTISHIALPIPSMYGIFTYILLIFKVNVGKFYHTSMVWVMYTGNHTTSKPRSPSINGGLEWQIHPPYFVDKDPSQNAAV